MKKCIWCEYKREAKFTSGFTGKSGPETWSQCGKMKKYIREIKKCDHKVFREIRDGKVEIK